MTGREEADEIRELARCTRELARWLGRQRDPSYGRIELSGGRLEVRRSSNVWTFHGGARMVERKLARHDQIVEVVLPSGICVDVPSSWDPRDLAEAAERLAAMSEYRGATLQRVAEAMAREGSADLVEGGRGWVLRPPPPPQMDETIRIPPPGDLVAAPAPRLTGRLVVEAGPCKGLEHSFEAGRRFTVGRSRRQTNALVLQDDRSVSRVHLAAELTAAGLAIWDNDSGNGTVVDGEPISHAVLRSGQRVTVGESVIRVELGESPPAIQLDPGDDALPLHASSGARPREPTAQTNLRPIVPVRFGELCVLSEVVLEGEPGRRFLAEGDRRVIRVVATRERPEALQPCAEAAFHEACAGLEALSELKRWERSHLCVCVGHGIDDHFAWIASEHFAGDDLESMLGGTDGEMDLREAIRIMLQILLPLEAVHERGLMHGDIRPSNVILFSYDTGRTETKLGRLGYCAAWEALGATARTPTASQGEIPDWLYYAAPETLSKGALPSLAADVYSAGALLFRMIAGTPPREFPAGVNPRLHAKEQPALRIEEAGPYLPEVVATVIGRALSHAPARRYPTCGRMRRALISAARQAGVMEEK